MLTNKQNNNNVRAKYSVQSHNHSANATNVLMSNISNFNKTNNKYVLSILSSQSLSVVKPLNSWHKTNNATPSWHCCTEA